MALCHWLSAPGSPAAVTWLWRRRSGFPTRESTAENMAMEHRRQLSDSAAIVWLMFLSLIPPAEAYDAGDALALLVGTILAVMGLCVFLGWYARRQNDRLWRRWLFTSTAAPVFITYPVAQTFVSNRLNRNVSFWNRCVKTPGTTYAPTGGGGEESIQEVRTRKCCYTSCQTVARVDFCTYIMTRVHALSGRCSVLLYLFETHHRSATEWRTWSHCFTVLLCWTVARWWHTFNFQYLVVKMHRKKNTGSLCNIEI